MNVPSLDFLLELPKTFKMPKLFPGSLTPLTALHGLKKKSSSLYILKVLLEMRTTKCSLFKFMGNKYMNK